MKTRQRIALFLCLACLTGLLSGCSGGKTLLTVDGDKVSEGIYGYFFGYTYANYNSSGTDAVMQITMQQLMQFLAIKRLAKEYKVTLEPLERKAVLDSMTQEVTEMGGKSAYNNFLKTVGLTEAEYRDIRFTYTLYAKLQDYLYNAETGIEKPTPEVLRASYETQYAHVRHILVSTQEAAGQADYDKALARANEALSRAQSGEDFVTLVREYNDDLGQDPEIGYYFTYNQMVEAFETTTYAMEIGAISEIVQSEFGYHIIQRLPIEESKLNEIAQDTTYYESYTGGLLTEKLTKIMEVMQIKTTDAFNTYDPSSAVSAWMS